MEKKKILFDEIAKNKNTQIINNINKSTKTSISKNILSAVIHNLLDNSVKFTTNGVIIFEENKNEDSLILIIKDSGIGMDLDKIEYYMNLQDNHEDEKLVLQKYGMGLRFIIELLKIINGKFIIEKLPKGTLFKLILKNKKE